MHLVNNNISETGRICSLKMEGLLPFLVELDIIQIASHCREKMFDIFSCLVLKIIGQYYLQQCRFQEKTHIPRRVF
jgi:hypothetical protein